MSKEKSQLENVALPIAEGGEARKNTDSALPASFSLGQGLKKEELTSRVDTVSGFAPSYQSQIDKNLLEEKEKRVWMEKEGMNYDLHLLIKEKLAGEFKDKLDQGLPYKELKKTSLFDYIKNDPKIYTPNEKDLIYIANNLRELLADQNISAEDYQKTGIFLNSLVHAYFNSVPEEKRKDLKFYLPNTEGLNFVGAELSFGELEVGKVKDGFGHFASGNVILKARKVGESAGFAIKDNAQIIVDRAEHYFGHYASGNSILRANNVGHNAGEGASDRAQITVGIAGNYFGQFVGGSTILRAEVEARDFAGAAAHGDSRLIVRVAGNNFGHKALERAILTADKAGDNVGTQACGNVQITVNKEAGDNFACQAHGDAVFNAKKVGDNAGQQVHGNAKIFITESYASISRRRGGNSQIILPDGRVLGAKDSA